MTTNQTYWLPDGSQTVILDGSAAPTGALSTAPPPAPEALRTRKCLEIDAARLAANSGTFQYLGKDIAVDALSRSDIDGVNGWVSLTGTLPDNWFGGWKATDNTVIPITSVAAWKDLYGALVAAGQATFLKSQQLKAHVAQLSTQYEMDLIRW